MRTIAAIATPLFNSPIHIIRVSGPDTFTILNKILKEPIKPIPNSIQRNTIIENNQNIDDVLLNIFINPRSYTGEDLVEINCHGNVLITKKILQLLILAGAQYAEPGEFSMQALINQKMNYSQIEATNNLITTKSEKACKLAINAILGLTEQKIKALRDQLFKITGSIEVNIDYPEYDDVPKYTNEQIINLIQPIKNELISIYNNSVKIQPIFSGFKIAIIGRPNVGKSSLLNLLSRQEKAIVSNIEGTTRDVIESDIVINGINIKLIDTAGIRKANDEIESIGINKSLAQIENADLIIYLKDVENIDDNDLLTSIGQKEYIEVINKSDLKKVPNKINISVINNDINELLDALEIKLSQVNLQDQTNVVLQSSRQLMICEQIINLLDEINIDINNEIPLDMVQTSFEQVIGLFNELLGINFEYDKLDELFKNFCIGK